MHDVSLRISFSSWFVLALFLKSLVRTTGGDMLQQNKHLEACWPERCSNQCLVVIFGHRLLATSCPISAEFRDVDWNPGIPLWLLKLYYQSFFPFSSPTIIECSTSLPKWASNFEKVTSHSCPYKIVFPRRLFLSEVSYTSFAVTTTLVSHFWSTVQYSTTVSTLLWRCTMHIYCFVLNK